MNLTRRALFALPVAGAAVAVMPTPPVLAAGTDVVVVRIMGVDAGRIAVVVYRDVIGEPIHSCTFVTFGEAA